MTTVEATRSLAEGKTKRIFEAAADLTRVELESKDDITAGDGAKHDIIAGKAALSTRTTSNVFTLLKTCGIPVAFDKQIAPVSFLAPKCTMLPYEVVTRREAHGSYLKRAPHLTKGHIFPKLVLEFFLKTSGKKWKEYGLTCDDPLIRHDWDAGKIFLYDPKEPDLGQLLAKPFLSLLEKEVFTRENERKLLEAMGDTARRTFLILERAWQLLGRKLVDMKVEFGIGPDGELFLADVIDNDSWRVVDDTGNYIDKQVYRDGGDLNEVTAKYQQVAELTGRFSLPHQRIILWCGSDSDDLKPFYEALAELLPRSLCPVLDVTCSVHRETERACRMLRRLVSEVPDTVIIAYIGMSNGGGPTLSANTTVPVVTVPAGYKQFPEDIWSSLRTPRNVPVMTVLEPRNAVRAALQILAMRNPGIYSALRFEQEKRMTDD